MKSRQHCSMSSEVSCLHAQVTYFKRSCEVRDIKERFFEVISAHVEVTGGHQHTCKGHLNISPEAISFMLTIVASCQQIITAMH